LSQDPIHKRVFTPTVIFMSLRVARPD
jgi:hypothetical protein